MRKFGFKFLILLSPLFTIAPVRAANNLQAANLTYQFLICINALFFSGIIIAMTYFFVKNRKINLDLFWSMLPTIFLLVIVGLGWSDFRDHHSGETFYAVKFNR